MKKFAYLPKIVDTWRHTNTRALIWLQYYYIPEECEFVDTLNDKRYKPLEKDLTPYCVYIGKCSIEIK